jgi:hypothetical protein
MSNEQKSDICESRDGNRGLDSFNKTNRKTPNERPIEMFSNTSSQTVDNLTVDELKPINRDNELYIEEIKPILKRKSLDEFEIKTLPSILKKRDSFDWNPSHKLDSNHPILKRHSLGSESDHRNPSVLLTTDIDISSKSASGSKSASSSKSLSHVHPILKHRSLDEKCIQSRDEQSLPKPILKKKWSIEDQIEKSCVIVDSNGSTSNTTHITNANFNSSTNNSNTNSNRTRSILKTGFDYEKRTTTTATTTTMSKTPEVRGILKVGQKNNSKPVKSALKKCDQISDNKSEVKSILKPETIGSNERIDISDTSSSSSDEENNSKVSDSELKTVDNDNNDNNNESKSSVLMPNSPAIEQKTTNSSKRNDEKR